MLLSLSFRKQGVCRWPRLGKFLIFILFLSLLPSSQTFIYDSYSCRVGKGTHFGIGRVKRFIRQCSENYARDAWCSCLESATGSRVSASLNCIQGKSGCSATRGECPFSAASSSPAACIRGPGCKRISHLQSNFKTLWFKRSHRVGLKPMPFAPL